MKKRLLLLLVTMGLVCTIVGCSKQADNSVPTANSSVKNKTVIKVALSDEPTPPFLYTDDNNNPIGYDIDYLKALETKLPEYEFKYELGQEESNLIGTATNKYAFSMNWFFKNPEREKKFLYSTHEYGYSITTVITKTNRNDIKSLDDLVGKKLPPMSPSGGLRSILNGYNTSHPNKQITIENMDSPSNTENMKGVASAKYDAIFLNEVTFENANKVAKLDLKVAGVVSKEPIFIVYNKNQTALSKKIDAATQELIKDGTLPKLSEKWFKTDFFKGLDYINKGYQYKSK